MLVISLFFSVSGCWWEAHSVIWPKWIRKPVSTWGFIP